MRNTGVVVFTTLEESEAECYCEKLITHFAMPIYFYVKRDIYQYKIYFDPWDGYLGNTSGYVDEINEYIDEINEYLKNSR